MEAEGAHSEVAYEPHVDQDSAPYIVESSLSSASPAPPKRRAICNVFLLGISFAILFSAYSPTQGYMTSLNKDMGYISLAVLYVVFGVVNLFAPMITLRLGLRLSLVLSGATYALFVASSTIQIPAIMLACSVLIGAGAAVLWNAQAGYLLGNSSSETVGMLSGLFNGLFYISTVTGSAGVGILFYLDYNPTMVFLVLTVVACSSLVVMCFLRPAPAVSELARERGILPELHSGAVSVRREVANVLVVFQDKRFLLFIPYLLVSGVGQSYYTGSFPPTLSDSNVDIAIYLFVLGICQIGGSLLAGKLSDRVGRSPIVFLSIFMWSLGICASFFSLQADSETHRFWWALATASLIGLGDVGALTMSYAILGIMFPHKINQGFAAQKLVMAGSTGVSMALGILCSVEVLALIQTVVLISASICFTVLVKSVFPLGRVDAKMQEQHQHAVERGMQVELSDAP